MRCNNNGQKLYKAALYAYMSAECYQRTEKYFLSWRCYTFIILLLQPKDYPLMISDVYKGLGDCFSNMGNLIKALEAYALASKYDHRNYYQILSSYSLAMKALKKSDVSNIKKLPLFDTPILLKESIGVEIIILTNSTDSGGNVTVSKFYDSPCYGGMELPDKNLKYFCGLNDTLIFTFDMHNNLNVDVKVDNLSLTACFVPTQNEENNNTHVCLDSKCHNFFSELLVGSVFLASRQTKSCSVKTKCTSSGKITITGYHFFINDASFSIQWTQKDLELATNSFLKSGTSVDVGSEAQTLCVTFDNISKGLLYGEMRELKTTFINSSDESIVLNQLNADGSIFFVQNNIARKEVYGCCINGECNKNDSILIKKLSNQCDCGHRHLNVRNDINAYKHKNNKGMSIVKINPFSSIDMKFVIWADVSGVQTYKIAIKCGTLSVNLLSILLELY